MKKTLALMLSLLMITASLAACKEADKPDEETKDKITTGENETPESKDPESNKPESNAPESGEPETGTGDENPSKIVPNNAWGLATKDAPYAFTLGLSIDEQRPAEVLDLSGMKYLEFDLHVSDPAAANAITGQNQLEISSGGTCDVEEYCWGQDNENQLLSKITLVEGWNHIKIALPEDWGACDPTRVNYMRWYYVDCSGTAEAQIANFCFTAE